MRANRLMPLGLGRLPDDLMVCDCAGCGELLTARGERGRLRVPKHKALPRTVNRRLEGRPYCRTCVDIMRRQGKEIA